MKIELYHRQTYCTNSESWEIHACEEPQLNLVEPYLESPMFVEVPIVDSRAVIECPKSDFPDQYALSIVVPDRRNVPLRLGVSDTAIQGLTISNKPVVIQQQNEPEEKDLTDGAFDRAFGNLTRQLGKIFDPIFEFFERYGVEGVFQAVVGGVLAIVTIPLEFIDAIRLSWEDIQESVVDGLEELGDDKLTAMKMELLEQSKARMDELKETDPERYEKLRNFQNSNTSRMFGSFIEFMTDGKITSWEARNFWPDGGLTGIEDLGNESVLFDVISAKHDALLFLYEVFGVGPGAGLLRSGNVLSGIVAGVLRSLLSADEGSFGFGDAGEAGVDRPVGSVPGDKIPDDRDAFFGSGSVFDSDTITTSPRPNSPERERPRRRGPHTVEE